MSIFIIYEEFFAPCEFGLGWITLNWAQINKASEKWIHPDFVVFFAKDIIFLSQMQVQSFFMCCHAMSTLGRISNFKLMLLSNINLFLKFIWTNEYFYNICNKQYFFTFQVLFYTWSFRSIISTKLFNILKTLFQYSNTYVVVM
jgi:hypothetical protein